jgi:hypothetical protein
MTQSAYGYRAAAESGAPLREFAAIAKEALKTAYILEGGTQPCVGEMKSASCFVVC